MIAPPRPEPTPSGRPPVRTTQEVLSAIFHVLRGVLRERIEGGEPADLHLSTDLAQPRRTAEAGKARMVVPDARNRPCVVAKADLKLAPDTLLDQRTISSGRARACHSHK